MKSILAVLLMLSGIAWQEQAPDIGWQAEENRYRQKTVTVTYLGTPVSFTLQQIGPVTEVVEVRPSVHYPHVAVVEYNAGQAGTSSQLVTKYRRALLDHCSGEVLGDYPYRHEGADIPPPEWSFEDSRVTISNLPNTMGGTATIPVPACETAGRN